VVRGERWSITHPQQQLAESNVNGEAYWLTLSDVYVAVLELADYFDGTVLLPPQESLAGSTKRLSVQWATTETET
jgi:hypothetical protein